MAGFIRSLRGRRRLVALALLLCLAFLWRAETEWRRLQARYLDLRQAELEAELDAARSAAADDLRFLEGELQVARDAIAGSGMKIGEARQRRRSLERRLREAERRLRAARDRGDAEALLSERGTVEGLREQVRLAGEAADDLRPEVLRAEKALAAARAPIRRLEERLAAVDGPPLLRSLPGLRGLDPGIHWRQTRTIGAAGEARVDRCVTCHLGALGQAPGDAGAPVVFAAHPRPDLYLAADSPHPESEVGCVACHGGNGRAVDFDDAGHGTSIGAGMQVESACVACHDTPWLADAPFQEAGRRWATYLRCAACHETGRDDLELAAPSLADLPRRTHPAWAMRWIAAPSQVRGTAWMPHFFDRMPAAERDAEVHALVTWLWRHADSPLAETAGGEAPNEEVGASSGDGRNEDEDEDEDEGEALWQQLACASCHPSGGDSQRELFFDAPRRLRGPLLTDLQTRYHGRRAALVSYLLEGHEPGLRLAENEARELAAALYARQRPGELPLSRPTIDPEVRDRLLLRRLRAVYSLEEAEAQLAKLGPTERDLRLGELAIERYACHACHELPGADARASRPASSLRDLGLRREPRAAIHDGLDSSLPRWHLSGSERAVLGVQIAGWRPPPVAPEEVPPPPPAGETVIARHGCRACHALGGNVGRRGVPPLDGIGTKLRSRWIFDYLGDAERHPLRLGPGVRMPFFRLTPTERSTLAEYFAAEAGVPLLSPDPPAPDAAERALGAAVYDILQCGRCHEGAEVGAEDPALPVPAVAPDYRRSAQRLRREWLVSFLLDPPLDVPMPAIFPDRPATGDDEAQRDATYLLASLETPMFDVQRRRLERFFAGREEMEQAFEEPHRVAEALADYLLSEDFATSGD